MSSVNKVILIGNIGRDPEIRSTQGGTRLANLSLATSESWKDKQTGEKREKTEWHRIVVWNEPLVDVIEKYVSKGSKIYIEGQLETRKWQDQSGEDRYTTEVVLRPYRGQLTLLGEGGAKREERPRQQQRQQTRPAPAREEPQERDDLDSEIPF